MKNNVDKVAVCSRSFSRNPVLRSELLNLYSNVTFNETGLQLKGDNLVKFLSGHSKAITALEHIDDWVLSSLPELKAIGKYGVGLDMINLHAMRKYGKRLGWIPGVNRRSVSELTIAFAISMLRFIPSSNIEVRSGLWQQHVGGMLTGKKFGIIGCGNVGRDLVELLKPFGCKIMVSDLIEEDIFYVKNFIEVVSVERLLGEADIVSLHVPLTELTSNIISGERLAMMKSTAILINTARGGLVDEDALKHALKLKKIAAAAFDVFINEPPHDVELLQLSNFLATPHIGGSSEEAVLAMGRAAIVGLDKNEIPGIGEENS